MIMLPSGLPGENHLVAPIEGVMSFQYPLRTSQKRQSFTRLKTTLLDLHQLAHKGLSTIPQLGSGNIFIRSDAFRLQLLKKLQEYVGRTLREVGDLEIEAIEQI